eukprot:3297852-Karenia_brevis.AAC.1
MEGSLLSPGFSYIGKPVVPGSTLEVPFLRFEVQFLGHPNTVSGVRAGRGHRELGRGSEECEL